ncbi:hypothetical protein KIW84_022151 [Lathyrus oleraceus]|uniref:Uncharacterized protein n=1 Tax=Pisum sativum TaxID=3888 RepID=A0A9D4Y9S2_PEA|nr:hypothetical protein KIW84_022151 [Pisum sativum]
MDSKKQFPCSPPYPFVITDYPPPPRHPTSPHISPPSPPATSTPPATNIGIISGVIIVGVKGQSDQIIDPHLIIGDIDPDSLKRFMEKVERCVADRGADRPSMRDVLWNLECCLQFQEVALHGSAAEDNSDSIVELATQYTTTDFSLTRVFSGLVISEEGM